MDAKRFFAVTLVLACLVGAAACDMSGPRPSWMSAGCARSLSITSKPGIERVDAAALLGSAVIGEADKALVEVNGKPIMVLGYAQGKEPGRPRVAFFSWDGYEFKKDADLGIQGSGPPMFSQGKAGAPAGIRNLNSFGVDEVVAKANGDCGEGSTRYTVLSRDGRNAWTLVFSGCERKTPNETVKFESKREGDIESLVIATYPPGGGEATRTTTLAWDGKSWRVSQTGEQGTAERGRSLDFRPPPAGLERLQLRFPTFNRSPLLPGQQGGGQFKLKPAQ